MKSGVRWCTNSIIRELRDSERLSGRRQRKAKSDGVGCWAGPREGAHPQLFRFILTKDKPGVYFPVKVIHPPAVAIWFMYYNFCRIHQTLRVTPAMESGLSDHVWTVEEMYSLLPETPSAAKRIDKGLILKALGEQAS